MFRKSLMERRCVVPTTGFFEWGPGDHGKKQKYRFNLPGGEKALYLAGLWNDFSGEEKYVILTTAANGSMEGIHDRMPVVPTKEETERWVVDPFPALKTTKSHGLERTPGHGFLKIIGTTKKIQILPNNIMTFPSKCDMLIYGAVLRPNKNAPNGCNR